MSIEAQSLLTQLARRFGASESSIEFQAIFLDSLNDVLDDIDTRLGLSTARVDTVNDSIDLTEQTYRPLITRGLAYFISEDGEWALGSIESLERKYERKLKLVHTKYLKSIDLTARFGDVDE